MVLVISTLDQDVELWCNPEDKDDVFTVQDIFDYQDLKYTVQQYLAEHEDGSADIQSCFDKLSEVAERLHCYPGPCPECGRYGGHSHRFE